MVITVSALYGLDNNFTQSQRMCFRQEFSDSKIHPSRDHGMYGDSDGIRSIVMCGDYEDDEDYGDTV